VAIFLRIGLSGLPYQLLLPGFCTIFFAVSASWIDAKHRIIPDNLNYSFLVIGLILAAVFPANWQTKIWYIALLKSGISCVITLLVLGSFTFIGRLIFKKEALGLGDVKYMTAFAALLGLYAVYFALLVGAITGSIYGIYTIVKSKRKAKKVAIPFGPFLSIGIMLWIFSAPSCFNLLLKLLGKN
jgi:leader peptidase (prepilin peptidase)/N-methyltransferase